MKTIEQLQERVEATFQFLVAARRDYESLGNAAWQPWADVDQARADAREKTRCAMGAYHAALAALGEAKSAATAGG